MNLLPGTTPKTFSLLSIGQRGVGKTVFLAGSYAELHSNTQPDNTQRLWFDCQDNQVKENIERLLNYVGRTGQYPPPTMKITDFDFSVKYHNSRWGEQTLCNFRWWDIPGESCNFDNSEFREMVFASNGCCVFIDGNALIHKPEYRQELDNVIQQVKPITTLVYLNNLKYAFAIILTKCDLLEFDSLTQQQLQEGLKPFTTGLDSVKANYQIFYLNIPIVTTEGVSILKAKGAAEPLLWLVNELSIAHNLGSTNNLQGLVTNLIPSSSQAGSNRVEGALESLTKPTVEAPTKKKSGLNIALSSRKYILILALAITGVLGAIGLFSLNDNNRQDNLQPGSPPATEQPQSSTRQISAT